MPIDGHLSNDRRSDKSASACDFFVVGYITVCCVCVYIYIYDLVKLVVEEKTPACSDNLLQWHLTYMGVVRNLAAAPTSLQRTSNK